MMTRTGLIAGCTWLLVLAGPAGAQPGGAPSAGPPSPADLLAGAKWQYSTDGGGAWSPQPPVIRDGKAAEVLARVRFESPDLSSISAVEFRHDLPQLKAMEVRLNGSAVPNMLPNVVYRTVPAIPAGLLRKGDNELLVRISIEAAPPPEDPAQKVPDYTVDLRGRLCALRPEHLAFVWGPVLGAAGKDFFSVTCRTNLPVPVTLTVRAQAGDAPAVQKKSQPGLFHRFGVEGLDPAGAWTYRLSVDSPPYRLEGSPHPVPLLRDSSPLRFVVLGDSRGKAADWAAVARAAAGAKPAFIVHTGDMTMCGRHDWLWQEHFFGPGAELFATILFYPVMGNHEENTALWPLIFHTPGGDGTAKDWSQRIGPVLLVAFDGQWSAQWDRLTRKWLSDTLAGSDAPFILALTHYPAWSSGKNGKPDPKTGQPAHWAYRNGRQVVVPLLARYQAAAMIVSHEHHYERSELPGGVTQIIAGGAGAPLSSRLADSVAQNPYAKVYNRTFHYCLFEATDQECTMRVLTPDGQEIDRRTWKARPRRD